MSVWIDFKELRASLDFEEVLRHYGVEVKRRGDQHHGFCPLPNHNGRRNSPSFSAHLDRGIFQCFGCKAKGNTLDFAALMERVDPENTAAFREVARRLQEKFCPERGAGNRSVSQSKPADLASATNSVRTVIINAPIDFELKGLDPRHPYLGSRGFTVETIDRFGLGFCSRGLLRDRIAIPLHDHKGQLIGYAGRVIDDNAITDNNPKYRFPSKRERGGKMFEFRKSRFLYNGFRIREWVDDLVVVEGFASVWWLDQNGFPSCVATMGSDCSDRQAELIIGRVSPYGRVWVLSDADPAGDAYSRSVLLQVAPLRLVKWLKLKDRKQPTDLSRQELKTLLSS
jgi:DNA primase